MVTYAEMQELVTTGLKTYVQDNFLSTYQLDNLLTRTAYANLAPHTAKISTGVQEGSEARLNYVTQAYNPLYGSLYFKLRLNSMADTFAFAGFKASLTAPTWGMTESHAGVFLYNGALYFSTGNGDSLSPAYQTTGITDCDMTRWLVYHVEGNRFRYYSLPYTVPYFDKNVPPALKQGIIRKWSPYYTNGATMPDDVVHYFVFYVKNLVNADKTLELEHLSYAEVYPD